MNLYDVIVVGAGAAGLTAAASATSMGANVAVLDMGPTPARKVLASGGGHCNFTNSAVSHARYFGQNPDFVRGALARTTPNDILEWMRKHKLKYTEKTPGQFICLDGAYAVRNALLRDAIKAKIFTNQSVKCVTYENNLFNIQTQSVKFFSQRVIIATGGISFATLGVSDTGYQIAKSFGHKIIPVRPALCAMAIKSEIVSLAGISMPVEIVVARERICDSLLFTHFGIGGPAIYRVSVRDFANGIDINLVPGHDLYKILCDAKHTNGRVKIITVLNKYMPERVARFFADNKTKNVADYKDSEIRLIADSIQHIHIDAKHISLHNMQSAEIVRGGISTDFVSSKTMESGLQPGLFFAGEVLDVAGDLGGFNLHWAWASGRVAGTCAAE